MSCYPVIIPDEILTLLKSDEKVLFTGYYNTTDINFENNKYSVTYPVSLSINPGGYNLVSGITFLVTDKFLPQLEYHNMTDTLSAWKDLTFQNKLGQINFNTLVYNKSLSDILSMDIIIFDVSSKSGIFINVLYLIYRILPTYRDIYFVGKKY